MIKRTHPPRPSDAELPLAPYPSLDFPSFYYKVRQRVGEDHSVLLVGLQVHRMRRVEEDHLLYLLQIFNGECPRVKAHLIQPHLVYAEFKIDIVDSQQQDQQVAELERKLFELLRTAQALLSQFLLATFNEKVVFSPHFDPQKFTNSFREEVVGKVKQKEESLFCKGKREY
jgi:hypothetical protein